MIGQRAVDNSMIGSTTYLYHEEFLSLQPMFPPKPFDNFPPEGGCSEGLGAYIFFLKHLLRTGNRIFPEGRS